MVDSAESEMLRVNVGCGSSPTAGWRNFDNSPSLWLARHDWTVVLLNRLGALNVHHMEYIRFAKSHSIEWADATKSIPLPDDCADVVYSSHMLEHLDRVEALSFLGEARRILCAGGIIRIAVPDLGVLVREYLKDFDADSFVAKLYLSRPKPRGAREKLARFFVGERQHHWMYDGLSLPRLLQKAGFVEAVERNAGETAIPNPGGLDLHERADQSVFVEALKPRS